MWPGPSGSDAKRQQQSCTDLDSETVSGLHDPRLLVYCSPRISKQNTAPDPLHVQSWMIQGLRWNSRPMPWPVNMGETEKSFPRNNWRIAWAMPLNGLPGPQAVMPASSAASVTRTSSCPFSSCPQSAYHLQDIHGECTYDISYEECPGGVPMEPIQVHRNIYGYDVAVLQGPTAMCSCGTVRAGL